MKKKRTFTLEVISMKEKQALSYDHSALLVSSLQQSVTFYKDILQLTELETPFPKDSIRWMDLGGNQQLHLILSQEHPKKNKGVHLA